MGERRLVWAERAPFENWSPTRPVLGLQAQAVYVRLILTNANFYSPHLLQQFCIVLR